MFLMKNLNSKLLFSTSFFLYFLFYSSQNIYFPKSFYLDSISLVKNMPRLAEKVVKSYSEQDKIKYLENLFRIQILSSHYESGIKSLNEYRKLSYKSDTTFGKSVGFQFSSFASAMLKVENENINFTKAYKDVLLNELLKLNSKGFSFASSYFNANVKAVKDNFYKIIEGLDKNTDSISVEKAFSLCKIYNSYLVYSKIIPIGKPICDSINLNRYTVQDSVLIRTSNGGLISAIIVKRKDLRKKAPAILMFNIYSSPKNKSEAEDAAYNGYIGIVANPRGKHLSPNEVSPFVYDAIDVNDVIDWISKHEWCDGRVGMYGGSYSGFTQWAAAKKLHPALKTIVPQASVCPGVDYPMINGVFISNSLSWIHYVTNNKRLDIADFRNNNHWDSVYKSWYTSGKSFKNLDSFDGRPNKIFQEWNKHPSFDSYWQKSIPFKDEYKKINIPILSITGYYDGDLGGAIYYKNQHDKYLPKNNHYFLIGPFDHIGVQDSPASEITNYTIDSIANLSISKVVFDWFDYIFNNASKPSILKNKINYQVMGTNSWKHKSSFKEMNNDTITLFLNSKNDAKFHSLSESKSNSNDFIFQSIDLLNRKDSSDEMSQDWNVIDTIFSDLNGVSFISSKMNSTFEFNGQMEVMLKLKANKADFDLKYDLYEVLPDSKYFWLTSYTGRASYIKDRTTRNLLNKNKIQNLKVTESLFTSKKISKDSRLLLVVSVIKSPLSQVNYGTGKPVSDENIKDSGEPLQIKWYDDSFIKIPVWRDEK